MKKKLIPIVILAAALGFAAVYVFGPWRRGDGNTIAVSGNIELTEVNVAFKTAGKLIERTVDEGDAVRKGMVLARLDPEQLLRQRDRTRASIESAQSRLTQLGTSIAYQEANIAGQIAQRRAELQAAEANLEQLTAGSRRQDIEQARAAADGAETAYIKAKSDFERAQALIVKDDISRADFDRFKSAFEGAGASLKQAREKLALVVEGPRREDIAAGRAQVARARAALRVAEASRIDLKRMREETVSRRADISQSRAESAVIDSQLNDMVAVSPIDGVVLVKSAEPGEVVAAGTTVLTVGDLDHPWLRAYINEQDLGRVKLGDKVRVTTDSFPGKTYWGRVSFISSEAEFTPKQIQTREERVKLVYRIKIDVDNPQHELKSNMPADAEILVGGKNS